MDRRLLLTSALILSGCSTTHTRGAPDGGFVDDDAWELPCTPESVHRVTDQAPACHEGERPWPFYGVAGTATGDVDYCVCSFLCDDRVDICGAYPGSDRPMRCLQSSEPLAASAFCVLPCDTNVDCQPGSLCIPVGPLELPYPGEVRSACAPAAPSIPRDR